jgi:predicted amidophosphoribosyltransferase
MDGSKLIRGKQCLDCNAVLNQADAYCYMCGQQAGKKRDRDLEQKRFDGTLDEGEVSVK